MSRSPHGVVRQSAAGRQNKNYRHQERDLPDKNGIFGRHNLKTFNRGTAASFTNSQHDRQQNDPCGFISSNNHK